MFKLNRRKVARSLRKMVMGTMIASMALFSMAPLAYAFPDNSTPEAGYKCLASNTCGNTYFGASNAKAGQTLFGIPSNTFFGILIDDNPGGNGYFGNRFFKPGTQKLYIHGDYFSHIYGEFAEKYKDDIWAQIAEHNGFENTDGLVKYLFDNMNDDLRAEYADDILTKLNIDLSKVDSSVIDVVTEVAKSGASKSLVDISNLNVASIDVVSFSGADFQGIKNYIQDATPEGAPEFPGDRPSYMDGVDQFDNQGSGFADTPANLAAFNAIVAGENVVAHVETTVSAFATLDATAASLDAITPDTPVFDEFDNIDVVSHVYTDYDELAYEAYDDAIYSGLSEADALTLAVTAAAGAAISNDLVSTVTQAVSVSSVIGHPVYQAIVTDSVMDALEVALGASDLTVEGLVYAAIDGVLTDNNWLFEAVIAVEVATAVGIAAGLDAGTAKDIAEDKVSDITGYTREYLQSAAL